jgi:hypothetical protein
MKWFRSLFAWRVVGVSGVWVYSINIVNGRRSADRHSLHGHSPLNWHWLLDGEGMPLINGIVAWRSAYRNSLPDGFYWR